MDVQQGSNLPGRLALPGIVMARKLTVDLVWASSPVQSQAIAMGVAGAKRAMWFFEPCQVETCSEGKYLAQQPAHTALLR